MIIMLGGRNGIASMISSSLGAGKLVFAYGMAGLFFGYLYFSIPRVVTTVMAATRKIEPMYEEAARTLGASSWRILKDVTVPALMPALLSTGAICFATSMYGLHARDRHQRAADHDLHRIHALGQHRLGRHALGRARSHYVGDARARAPRGRSERPLSRREDT